MELTRTERLILETAADLFDFEIGASRAATMTKIELTPAELEAVGEDGGRPQLGDLLVSRGWLTQDQLEQALDRVYGEVQGWSERLVAPTPAPVPKPTTAQDQDAQLAELVHQLTGLLDVLVAGGEGDATIVRRAAVAFDPMSAPIAARGPRPAPGHIRVEVEAEDEDTKDIPALSGVIAAPRQGIDEDASTLSIERGVPVPADEQDAPTMQMERAALPQRGGSDQGECDAGTLHLQRPEAKDDDTAHFEREPISPDESGVAFNWSPPKDDDTAHFERPEGGTVHVERSVITTGDTVIIEGSSNH